MDQFLAGFFPAHVSNMCSTMTVCKAESCRADTKQSVISAPREASKASVSSECSLPGVSEGDADSSQASTSLSLGAWTTLDSSRQGGEKGLANRRSWQKRVTVETMSEPLAQHALRRKIRTCCDIEELYVLGEEVFPSCHPGMQIFYATRVVTDQEVVIKVRQKKTSFNDADDHQSWRESTELMLNLPCNSSIAHVYEVLETDAAYHVVMERAGGKDLCETLRAGETLPVAEVKEVLRQLLSGLAQLHDRGCIHKDLKLENVMLDRTPSPNCSRSPARLSTAPPGGAACAGADHGGGRSSSPPMRGLSFAPTSRGWASGMGRRPSVVESESSPFSVKVIDFDTLEQVGGNPARSCSREIHGTDQYLAPETYEGEYSRSSDIFSVGVIAYALLTGRFPFSDDIYTCQKAEYYAGSPKMQEVRAKMSEFKVDWSHPVFKDNPLARDLVQRMIAVDKSVRPSVRSALSHTWFKGIGRQLDAADASLLHGTCGCPSLAASA